MQIHGERESNASELCIIHATLRERHYLDYKTKQAYICNFTTTNNESLPQIWENRFFKNEKEIFKIKYNEKVGGC